MGHLLSPRHYKKLQRRMDRAVPGIHDSKHLYEILKLLFTDEEARLCSLMPLNFFTVPQIAKVWGKSEEESRKVLENLNSKGLVYTLDEDNTRKYVLAPPVLGFFEFSLMRNDGKFDAKLLSKFYHQYINQEDGFINNYMDVNPPLSRVFPHEDMIENVTSEVLSYEKASVAIKEAACITVGTCFCRHKMEHMGKACDNPQDVCLTFNSVAEYLAENGIARKISTEEGLKILDLCMQKGLMQIGDNVKSEIAIICNCCGCCCDLLLGYKKYGLRGIVSPSNYVAQIDQESCTDGGLCVKKCGVNAITKIGDNYTVNKDVCLGCGVCTRFCTSHACRMAEREKKVYVPDGFFEKIALWVIHQGKVGNYIFDKQTSFTHKIMRNVVNFILKIPPIKKILSSKKAISLLLKMKNYNKP